jgi:hypothetical protein
LKCIKEVKSINVMNWNDTVTFFFCCNGDAEETWPVVQNSGVMLFTFSYMHTAWHDIHQNIRYCLGSSYFHRHFKDGKIHGFVAYHVVITNGEAICSKSKLPTHEQFTVRISFSFQVLSRNARICYPHVWRSVSFSCDYYASLKLALSLGTF